MWRIMEPLFIIALLIFVIWQWLWPMIIKKPTWPMFRREKQRPKTDKQLSAKEAWERASYHITKAMHYMALAGAKATGEKTAAETAKQASELLLVEIEKRSNGLKDESEETL